jgi:S1-C subfamily serine protease
MCSASGVTKGVLSRTAFTAAVVAAVIVTASALFFGRAGTASSAVGPRTGVVVVDTNLAFVGSAAAGTGIVLSPSGLVLTNNHVIRGATKISVTDPSDGKTFPARVLGYSVLKDIALLQLQHPSGLKAARLGNSSSARVGQAATAVGNAGGTGSLSVVTGRVTALRRSISVSDDQGGSTRLVDLIETSAPLQPGDSGGPLLVNGRVIGVDAAASRTSVFDDSGDGFAIPINTALSIAHQIRSGRRSSTVHIGPTAFLGVLLARPDYPDDSSGAIVQSVVSGSAAARAGIEGGDVITGAAGREIASASDLRSVMLQIAPGKALRLLWTDSSGRSRSATVRPPAGPPQ